jgi:16S rRNA (guanine527-N7)-methyltransferase
MFVMNIPNDFFPWINQCQLEQYNMMEPLYHEWNARINVISRKDIGQFAVRHLLHSLAIARAVSFVPGTRIMDAGTGGGFPGIPLAVMFPESEFVLVDSIGKKIRVVEEVRSALRLQNVVTRNTRFETMPGSFDFITGRAVTDLSLFASMVKKNIRKNGINNLENGILYLTGGETESTIATIPAKATTWNLDKWFPDPFFSTKKLIHLSAFQD